MTTVYLQHLSDPDGDGVADALYFPNKYLPVRDDIFGRIAWQLLNARRRKSLRLDARIAFDLRKSVKEAEYVIDSRTGKFYQQRLIYAFHLIINRMLKSLNLFITICHSTPNLMVLYSMMMRS